MPDAGRPRRRASRHLPRRASHLDDASCRLPARSPRQRRSILPLGASEPRCDGRAAPTRRQGRSTSRFFEARRPPVPASPHAGQGTRRLGSSGAEAGGAAHDVRRWPRLLMPGGHSRRGSLVRRAGESLARRLRQHACRRCKRGGSSRRRDAALGRHSSPIIDGRDAADDSPTCLFILFDFWPGAGRFRRRHYAAGNDVALGISDSAGGRHYDASKWSPPRATLTGGRISASAGARRAICARPEITATTGEALNLPYGSPPATPATRTLGRSRHGHAGADDCHGQWYRADSIFAGRRTADGDAREHRRLLGAGRRVAALTASTWLQIAGGAMPSSHAACSAGGAPAVADTGAR